MRISLELLPTEGDRLDGRVVNEDGLALAFSGTLDLLRAIEELRRANGDAAGKGAGPASAAAPRS
jgi:hypothetical protein